jgi:hypothetical protein
VKLEVLTNTIWMPGGGFVAAFPLPLIHSLKMPVFDVPSGIDANFTGAPMLGRSTEYAGPSKIPALNDRLVPMLLP